VKSRVARQRLHWLFYSKPQSQFPLRRRHGPPCLLNSPARYLTLIYSCNCSSHPGATHPRYSCPYTCHRWLTPSHRLDGTTRPNMKLGLDSETPYVGGCLTVRRWRIEKRRECLDSCRRDCERHERRTVEGSQKQSVEDEIRAGLLCPMGPETHNSVGPRRTSFVPCYMNGGSPSSEFV
jgi:hypothetical protein